MRPVEAAPTAVLLVAEEEEGVGDDGEEGEDGGVDYEVSYRVRT